jgi:hypothetical protein
MAHLTVQNAEIKTATVEVRTLTISGKQVTLAVFRQLVEERLMLPDGNLRGIPWGRVNYHPDRACSHTGPHGASDGRTVFDWCEASHMHVVWQKGTELRRSLLWNACACHRRDEDDATRTQRLSRQREVFRTMADLPQLFIAV